MTHQLIYTKRERKFVVPKARELRNDPKVSNLRVVRLRSGIVAIVFDR